MSSMWESVKRGLQDGAAVVFDRAEGLTQIGRTRLDVAAAKTRQARLHVELGRETFRLLEAGSAVADSERVRSLCQALRDARTQLRDAEAAFDHVRREQARHQANDPDGDAPLGT